jgi:A/G-specific adenine glycosylase
MTVNRIGRKNFMIKLAPKELKPRTRGGNGQNKRKLGSFSAILSKWDQGRNSRQMPWKGEKDPYKIWLSEIILQQTRVEQGLKYYEKFITAFPDVHQLANAPEQTIYKHWEGLGYYSRCRNLIATARNISKNLKGKFPGNYDEIKKLKGIGPYTAAAIASFAFNEQRAVVDGNVFRVLSRIFGINEPIDSTEGKKVFNKLADNLLDRKNPALHNQAIMDFGAVVCKPVPTCRLCPFKQRCDAFLNDTIFSLPVKGKKVLIRKRWFNYVLLEYNQKLALRQRLDKDIWHNLFEFLLVESGKEFGEREIVDQVKKKKWIGANNYEIEYVSPIFKQQLSHQLINGRFIKLKLYTKPELPTDVLWVRKKEIKNYAFPMFINQHLKERDV